MWSVHLECSWSVCCCCRTALGMYDVQLAYMVVAHSQRDPGEYLLELQQLVKAPSENLRRHAMDMHLKRFPSALQHLVAAGDQHFHQALQLARAKVSCTHTLSSSLHHLTQDHTVKSISFHSPQHLLALRDKLFGTHCSLQGLRVVFFLADCTGVYGLSGAKWGGGGALGG